MNLKFRKHSLKLNIQTFITLQRNSVRTIRRTLLDKFENVWLRILGRITFRNVHPIGTHVNENEIKKISIFKRPRPGSVVVERSPGMWEVGGSIPDRVKQKTLKFEVLLLCLALSTKELESVWPARSQNNGLGWDIPAYPWSGVSVG